MITQLRPAGGDDLAPEDYRDIFQELRANRSLRKLVHAAGAPESRIAYWSRYERDPEAVPDFAGRNELRRLVGLSEIDPVAGDVVASAVDPAAAVWRVGNGEPAGRVLLLDGNQERLTVHVNGAAWQVMDGATGSPLYSDVHGPRRTQQRKCVWRPTLPLEWRLELKKRDLSLREIVEKAIHETVP